MDCGSGKLRIRLMCLFALFSGHIAFEHGSFRKIAFLKIEAVAVTFSHHYFLSTCAVSEYVVTD